MIITLITTTTKESLDLFTEHYKDNSEIVLFHKGFTISELHILKEMEDVYSIELVLIESSEEDDD